MKRKLISDQFFFFLNLSRWVRWEGKKCIVLIQTLIYEKVFGSKSDTRLIKKERDGMKLM